MKNNTNILLSTNRKRQIMIVDDEAINREILGAYLKDDFELLFAGDGSEAIGLIHEHKDTLSLVLLDLLMPVMSGKEVLKQVREDPEIMHIPVIVITSDQESEVECLNLGAIDFIPKPYPQPDVVMARVLRTIELFEDRKIIQSTERDSLSGLYNKEFFYRYGEKFDLHNKEKEMDAVLIDVHHFHLINERFGKEYGDELLRSIGRTLLDFEEKSGGFACRKEADNFMLYSPHGADYQKLLADMLGNLSKDVDDSLEDRIRFRMGVYPSADKSLTIEQRFDRAKAAADSIRGSYQKMIGFYDEAMHKKEIYAEQLLDDFETALREHQFCVYYQPKYHILGKKPVLSSAEALIRWKHPEIGMIPPGVFIPLFEENGLIQRLDNYVWEETARQIREWKSKYEYSVPVSVNVSRVDLYDPNLLSVFEDILKRNRVNGDDLLLEITESAYTQDSVRIIDVVSDLRKTGFHIEMDDFGTGYSSLNMISQLPIDALKLDMMFIRNAFKEGGDTRMIEVIMDIANYLAVPVIAEGVETEDQMRSLRALGCDIVQGYYFSKPVPAEEFETFLQQHNKDMVETKEIETAEKKISEEKRLKEITEMYEQSLTDEESPEDKLIRDIEENQKKGIQLQTLSIIFTVIAFLTGMALFLANRMVIEGYKRMDEASERYITARQAASDLEGVSDYLTDNVRSFVVSGSNKYMQNYFEELNITKRREKALSDLQDFLHGEDPEAFESLSEALSLSNELCDREYLAMRLMLDSEGYDPLNMPEAVGMVRVDNEYKTLQPEEKREKARELVFDDYYMDYKTRIRENVSKCTEILIHSAHQELERALKGMDRLLEVQTILTVVMLAVVLCLVGVLIEYVRKPLSAMVSQMSRQKPILPTGAEELRYVARTYNQILWENKKIQSRLSYEATHDVLTGLYNRGAFEMFLQSLGTGFIALAIIDVDHFRTIEKEFGHVMGDESLKRVAEILTHSFRKVDVVCRIGGDTFAVIVPDADSSMQSILRNKIYLVNRQLESQRRDLPSVSVSAGIVISEKRKPAASLVKDADDALMQAKQSGEGRCVII